MAATKSDDIIYVNNVPFYMNQPSDELQKIGDKYSKLLKETFGNDLKAVHPMGSGAIKAMPGTPVVDLVLFMTNFPPTEEQLQKFNDIGIVISMKRTPHDDNDMMLKTLPKDGENPNELGRVNFHFVHYANEWARSALAFVAYLNENEEAFNRYRDVKIEGIKLQEGKVSEEGSLELFYKYKQHKGIVVKDLMADVKKWAFDDGNFQLPDDILVLLE